MRTVNPDDLERLAVLLDGRGGVRDNLDKAFTRASRLGVSAHLARLRPMGAWSGDTARDLRRRATFARLENGDRTAGLHWAGFSLKEISEAGAALLSPEPLIIAYAMAASSDPKADSFRRRPDESAHDWADRVRAHAIAQIPALRPYENQIRSLIGLYGDVTGAVDFGARSVFLGANVTRVIVGNSFARGWGVALKNWSADNIVSRIPLAQAEMWAADMRGADPVIASLSAPGTWLPSHIAGLASGSSLFRDANRIPFIRNHFSAYLNNSWDEVMSSGAATATIRGWSANRLVITLVGNDTLAQIFGGLTHSGQAVKRAGQASLYRVAKNTYTAARVAEAGRAASVAEALENAFRVSGGLRTLGVVGGLGSTIYSGYNLYTDGNPTKHFGSREEGASYVADVAEFGFNASLTAATVCPNPYTIGAAAVFGTAYVGAKTVEHWDDVKSAAKSADKWVGKQVDNLTEGKGLARAANPMSWF
ncbi:PE-PGRS family protein [Streptomyces sp. NPDC048179]|uniref:PE-PGRS family protein n=1 Tax=Streptomyces sp. NPDC048179 TaxID=3365506 RepID=UPI00371FCEC4